MNVPGLSPVRRDLTVSLLVLGGILSLALAGLAVDGNWPKVLRVLVAALGYGTALLWLLRREADGLPWGSFATAGAVAGLLSGLVRPEVRPSLLLAQLVLGSLVLGSFHWLALRSWRRLLPRA